MKQKSLNKTLLKLIFFFLIFSSCILFIKCSQSTNDNDDLVSFTGIVTLEGETDYSAVKVSLYKPVELDTALVRINQQYPNIGVQISQETMLDHHERKHYRIAKYLC
jgi:hypothetical protein